MKILLATVEGFSLERWSIHMKEINTDYPYDVILFMFKKLLIANRGEIACVLSVQRVVGIKQFAIYSEADKDSLILCLLMKAICIRPANQQILI